MIVASFSFFRVVFAGVLVVCDSTWWSACSIAELAFVDFPAVFVGYMSGELVLKFVYLFALTTFETVRVFVCFSFLGSMFP